MPLEREYRIPVFVYPNELTFYQLTPSTHKQILTLYNPYEHPVKYKIYSNADDKYSVVEPEGAIAALSYIDLLVRHNAPNPTNCHAKDKFMITFHDVGTNKEIGRKGVQATLLPGTNEANLTEAPHQALNPEFRAQHPTTPQPDPVVKHYAALAMFIFIVILFLPTKQEPPEETTIPSYLHVTMSLKITISYILGLMTMAFLRPVGA